MTTLLRQVKLTCTGRGRHTEIEIGKVVEDDDPDPRLRSRIVGTGSRASKSSGQRVTVVRKSLNFDDHGVIHAVCRKCRRPRDVRIGSDAMVRLFDTFANQAVDISTIS